MGRFGRFIKFQKITRTEPLQKNGYALAVNRRDAQHLGCVFFAPRLYFLIFCILYIGCLRYYLLYDAFCVCAERIAWDNADR